MANHANHIMETERTAASEDDPSLHLTDLPLQRQNQLLEMLHVPLLHGGEKEVLLVEFLTTTTTLAFTLACLGLAFFAASLEMLRLLMWWVEDKYALMDKQPFHFHADCKECVTLVTGKYNTFHEDHHGPSSLSPSDSTTPLTARTSPISRTVRQLCLASSGLLQVLLYLIGTMLMLIAMTMNVYLILSMGMGSGIGKLMALTIKRRMMRPDNN